MISMLILAAMLHAAPVRKPVAHARPARAVPERHYVAPKHHAHRHIRLHSRKQMGVRHI